MTELERALLQLGRELEFPPEPDLRGRVRERIVRRRWVRPLAFAVALAVVAFGVAMAVPPARSAILDFFHIGAVTIQRVETLPPAKQAPLTESLGPVMTRAAAEQDAGFRLVLRGVQPSRFYSRPGLIATLLQSHGTPVLFAEFAGDQMAVTKKLTLKETHIEPADIGPFGGAWLTGGKHVILWTEGRIETARLAGNVLIWADENRTFRLEGDLSKDDMLQLARDITQ
jgi:hypothetical protein